MSFSDDQLAQLRSTIQGGSGDLAILIGQVDPDALGAAFGLQEILDQLRGAETGEIKIAYCGRVGHPQNRAIINRCNLRNKMIRIGELELAGADRTALVDSCSLNDTRFPESMLPLSPFLIVDHHRSELEAEEEENLYWVEEVGAASTLIIELADRLEVDLGHDLSLLLAMGIYTDTKALVGAGERDRRAYAQVTRELRPEEMNRLINYTLPGSYFSNFYRALSNMDEADGRLVAGVGQLKPEEGDDLSAIADALLRKSGVNLVVVWGIVGKKVRVSARSSDLSIPLDEFLQSRFGKDSAGAKMTPDGRGEGGALVELDLGIWMSESVQEQTETLVGTRMREMVLPELPQLEEDEGE